MIWKIIKYCPGFFLAIFNFHVAKCQSKGVPEIEKALRENKTEIAENILQPIIDGYYKENKTDSLVNYILYVGKIAKAKSGSKNALKSVDNFIEKIKSLSPASETLKQTYIEAGEFYGLIGFNKRGYEADLEALKYISNTTDKRNAKLALIENNLSIFAQRMGDLKLSISHRRKGLQYLLSDPKPNNENLYFAYNGMGASMWYISKEDSALYYYNKALEALEKSPQTPINRFYRPAIIFNNLSGLYELQGNTSAAIDALKTTINNLNKFIASKEPDPKKMAAIPFQFEATDNLAGIYKELGDLKKAGELLEYSYAQKQKNLEADNPGIFISQILLGQLYFAKRNYDKSLQFLNSGLNKISASEGDYIYWQADASKTLALLYNAKHETKKAAFFYEKADSLYEASAQGEYDNIYLEFLRNEALFFAENNQTVEAIAKAKKGYNYIVKTEGKRTLLAFYQLLNLSEINLLAGNFKKSLDYSNEGLNLVNKIIGTSDNLLDSIRMELKKPKAILQKTKAEYALLKTKDTSSLLALLDEMNDALKIIERQKTLLSDPQDINLLMSDHSDLLEFMKKITLELYNQTGNEKYLDRLISLHESGIYNRIRARLDKDDSLQFINIPAKTTATEKQLKTSISRALKGTGTHDEKMQHYLEAIDNFEQFKNELKVEHPDYYKLRYASIFKSLGNIRKLVPHSTTLIRYFFIDKKLYALVIEQKKQIIIPLESKGIEEKITLLAEQAMNERKISETLYELYQQLWAPLSKNIHNDKLIVIPDGILYDLNFEILTPLPINSFRELASKSLLAHYCFSYNYSLFLVGEKRKNTSPDKNFVAFAPGFSDKLKNDYKSIAKNNIEIDRSYLSLLPQPFSINFAVKMKNLLGGKYFINEASTKKTFIDNAGNHKIIQISTHAESNNDHPSFSRLIFAKNTIEGNEDNSLFVDDIYNCNLASNLAVLTACESGKPGYQDGEGMVSLAHAFNYAGSKSILMGLWKIDEQASTLLLGFFYKNLLKGMPKDEALRQAKLSYLKEADGRMLAPQYWAGMVIMGDTSPIMIQPPSSPAKLITTVFVILLISGIGYFAIRSFKKKRFSKSNISSVEKV